MRMLQLGQSLEQNGDWEQASKVYEDLFRRDSSNYVYFDALRRSYGQLKEYRKAIAMVERRLRVNPGEAFLRAQLGGLMYDAGNPSSADSLWKSALVAQPAHRQMYVIVAQQQQERRLYEHAIATFRAGRQNLNLPAEFVDELALLLSATQNYAGAVEEFLRMLKIAPHQLPYVQTRVASFTIRDQGIRQAREVVANAVAEFPDNVTFRTFLSWIEMERGEYWASLEQVREIDRRSNIRGTELYSFGQRTFRARALRQAQQAFRDAIDIIPASPIRPLARLGYAQCAEELSTPDSSRFPAQSGTTLPGETFPTVDQAVGLYQAIIAEYPGSDAAIQAEFRVGMVRFERLFDLDGALAAFESLRANPRGGLVSGEALLMSADVNIARNDLASARTVLSLHPPAAPPDFHDRRQFRLAQIDAYEARIDSALSRLKPLTSTVDRDLANDALSLHVFLSENKGTPELLGTYLHAELLSRQRKSAESLAQYRELIRTESQAPLIDDAMMRIADLQVALGRPLEALGTLRTIDTAMTTSKLRDRALFRVAEITELIVRDRINALRAYEDFLRQYPYSLFTEEARKRVRALREDSL